MIPHIVNKLDGFSAGDNVRVTTTDDYEVEGCVEFVDSNTDAERPRDRDIRLHVIIPTETADKLDAVHCNVDVSATRLSDGWTDPDVSYPVALDEHGIEECATLGELESIDCTD
ncbi:hypothetical protein [Haloferax denitrificans]|uniref:hypothetical protein n=1 Tax=Haloferax denitrificans TaxID=35745 RepID=UPI003C6EC3FE